MTGVHPGKADNVERHPSRQIGSLSDGGVEDLGQQCRHPLPSGTQQRVSGLIRNRLRKIGLTAASP
ncbi:hypothetical protein ACIQVK_22150 [Streptomyces sp. NPDC090493]|uniref:hypothetical protein n=1 Tax=Streptomyces sp. NPDC090493 TaxID=3365964 RepID=UPI0037F73125